MVTMETMAKEVRELYLAKFQPQRRPHALSPSVLLRRLDPALCEKLTARNNREKQLRSVRIHPARCLESGVEETDRKVAEKQSRRSNEGQSEEEDWLGAEENDVVVSDSEWSPAAPPADPPAGDATNAVNKKRKRNTGKTGGRKKNSITSMLRGIKQERQDDDVTPVIPMTVVPTTVYSQSDTTMEDPLSQPDPLAVTETSSRTRIKQEPEENVIVMPFSAEATENAQSTDNSNQVVLGDSTEETDDGSGNRPRKSLKELTQYLLELNNKNLQFEDRIQKLREEYERRVAVVENEKKLNEKEIDKVLAQIQSWKPPSSPSSFVDDASGARSSSSASSPSSQKRKKSSSDPDTEDLAKKKRTGKPRRKGYDVKPLAVKYWAVRALEAGQSRDQVMSKYGVAASTLSDWFRHKRSIKQAYENGTS